MLREHGEVLAADSGRPDCPPTSRPSSTATGSTCSDRGGLRGQEPGRAERRAGDRRRARARAAGAGRAGAGLAAAAEPLRGGHRHQRQDDHGRAARRDLARRPACRWRWPATWARRCPRSWARSSAEATVVCEVSSFQAEDSVSSRPTPPLLLNLDRGPPRPPRQLRRLPRRQAEPVRAPGAASRSPSPRRASSCPGAARRVDFGDPARAAARRRRRSACAAPHNLENAMGASAAALAAGVPAEAVAAALRGFAGVPHRLEEVGDGRRRALRERLQGHQRVLGRRAASSRSRAGVHAILGGSLKGGGFAGLREPVAARCRACYLIGEAADRLAADLDGTGVPLRALRRPRDRRAAAARRRPAGRGGAALAGLRQVRPVPRTTRSAATASGRSCSRA